MSLTLAASRSRHLPGRKTARQPQRSDRRVGLAWGLLFLDMMAFSGSIVPVPSVVGKAVTQGALALALLVLLSVNHRVTVRPSLFLCLLTLLPLEAVVTALHPQFIGSEYRTFRLAAVVVALWLLSPWWGRRDLLLVRCHLAALAVILASVILGVLASPGQALDSGRLQGVLWAIPPTQVAHYAAVSIGLVVILWACGHVSGRVAAPAVTAAAVILILTHTRTALTGLVVGMAVAGLSLVAASARMRKLFAGAVAIGAIGALTLSGFITTWLARGQDSAGIMQLTGRTKVWGPLLALHRDKLQELFGFGLSNSSFNGLPIDSNWLASYQQQGLFGVVVGALIVLALFVTAFLQPSGPRRAMALFLVSYCLVVSFTEDAFNDPTPYLLDLTVAASLLMPPLAARRRRTVTPSGRTLAVSGPGITAGGRPLLSSREFHE